MRVWHDGAFNEIEFEAIGKEIEICSEFFILIFFTMETQRLRKGE